MHVLTFFFFFYIMLLMSWPSNPDGSIQVAGEIINTGIEAIHSLSHWFMNANVIKGAGAEI